MFIEPKPLSQGWFNRALKGAVKLIARAPLWWFVLTIGFPILMTHTTLYSVKALMWGIVVILSTDLAIECDHDRELSLREVVRVFTNNPQFIWLNLIGCVGIFFLIDMTEFEWLTKVNQHYIASGLALMMLDAMLAIIIFIYIFMMSLSDSELDRDIFQSIEKIFSTFKIPSTFTCHVLLDLKTGWEEACHLSAKGYRVLREDFSRISWMLLAMIICPAFSIIVLPWLYLVYKEIFFGGSQRREHAKSPSAKRSGLKMI